VDIGNFSYLTAVGSWIIWFSFVSCMVL